VLDDRQAIFSFSRAALALSLGLALSLASTVGCGLLDPQTGPEREACVDADSNPLEPVDFKTQIRPLLDGHVPDVTGCALCHYASGGTHEGLDATGLDLESLRTIRAGGRNTPPESILVAGKPCSSAIVKKLEGTFAGQRMPKGGPYWDEAHIQLVKDWIAEGAHGEDDE
jgi:hypothetical protein